MTRSLMLSAVLLCLATAPALAQQATSPPGDAGHGEALARQWCSSCHLLEGQGKTTDTAPAFGTIAHDPRMTPDHLRGFLSHPHAQMPPLELSRSEISDLIAYFGELAKR